MSKIRVDFAGGGRVTRINLADPKANILDRPMIADMDAALEELLPRRDLAAVVVAADGPHFSFGASVEEHVPDQIGETLEALHGLLRKLLEVPAPTIAAVRGQCLGGGLELALACDLILAEENARIGCPEIKLAVFPPAASALLPARVGGGRTTDLVLTGRSWTGKQAAVAGLVARIAPEGELNRELRAWLEAEFLPRSPAALRQAVLATRRAARRALEEDLPELERQYLEELMAEPDALEGINAFLERRSPIWGGEKPPE